MQNKPGPDEDKPEAYVIVPLEKISEDALSGLIDEFILREGTDYGNVEYTLQEKHAQVLKQLENGFTLIVFDTTEESVSLMRAQQIRR